MSTIKKTTPTPISTKSLFDSILENEKRQASEMECQKHANRVGLLFKVLYNRNLIDLRELFESRLEQLCKDFANSVDNELRKTEKDN